MHRHRGEIENRELNEPRGNIVIRTVVRTSLAFAGIVFLLVPLHLLGGLLSDAARRTGWDKSIAAGVFAAGFVAVLVAAGFLVHRHRRGNRAMR